MNVNCAEWRHPLSLLLCLCLFRLLRAALPLELARTRVCLFVSGESHDSGCFKLFFLPLHRRSWKSGKEFDTRFGCMGASWERRKEKVGLTAAATASCRRPSRTVRASSSAPAARLPHCCPKNGAVWWFRPHRLCVRLNIWLIQVVVILVLSCVKAANTSGTRCHTALLLAYLRVIPLL